jgi:RNA-directed DNA polymerase
MKRHGGVWSKLVSFENLYLAYRKARRGKRHSRDATRFEHHLKRELSELRLDLITQQK